MSRSYRFGLFGHPVKHSLSPVMHAASFQSLGIQAEYVCVDVPPDALPDRLAASRDEGFDGLNVTLPHKEATVGHMNRLDATARLFGAVNTVRIVGRRLIGYNTDADGFLTDLRARAGITPEGRRVLILGCGGAGRALAIACARECASAIGLADRIPAKAVNLADEIPDRLPDMVSQLTVLSDDPEIWARFSRECDLIVHCTQAGLYPQDVSPLPVEAFRAGQLLYDLVYTSRVTVTMRAALSGGAEALNGMGMLIHQGAAAFTIWTGLEADTAAMQAALEERMYVEAG